MEHQEWSLPGSVSIKLSQDELMLLDWVTCSASHLIPDADIDYLVVNWHDFRILVWAAIHEFGPGSTATDIPISEGDARVLLAVVPTTFRWGTGSDCGYSLKMKLSKFLRGVYEDDHEQDQAQTDNETADQPTDPTAA